MPSLRSKEARDSRRCGQHSEYKRNFILVEVLFEEFLSGRTTPSSRKSFSISSKYRGALCTWLWTYWTLTLPHPRTFLGLIQIYMLIFLQVILCFCESLSNTWFVWQSCCVTHVTTCILPHFTTSYRSLPYFSDMQQNHSLFRETSHQGLLLAGTPFAWYCWLAIFTTNYHKLP